MNPDRLVAVPAADNYVRYLRLQRKVQSLDLAVRGAHGTIRNGPSAAGQFETRSALAGRSHVPVARRGRTRRAADRLRERGSSGGAARVGVAYRLNVCWILCQRLF
jgi:hypothetical protein